MAMLTGERGKSDLLKRSLVQCESITEDDRLGISRAVGGEEGRREHREVKRLDSMGIT